MCCRHYIAAVAAAIDVVVATAIVSFLHFVLYAFRSCALVAQAKFAARVLFFLLLFQYSASILSAHIHTQQSFAFIFIFTSYVFQLSVFASFVFVCTLLFNFHGNFV